MSTPKQPIEIERYLFVFAPPLLSLEPSWVFSLLSPLVPGGSIIVLTVKAQPKGQRQLELRPFLRQRRLFDSRKNHGPPERW